jgi:hypothetical protein
VPHDLLRLQRSAGNAAVTRMLQRKIGFELESGFWRSAWLDEPVPKDAPETGYVPLGVKTKPPPARKAFYEKGIVRGTADELPKGVRDVEFVIKEQDEAALEQIGAAFDDVDKAYDTMTDQLLPAHWFWPEKRLGWAPPDAETWLLDKDTAGETIVQLQATAGIPLDQLAPMMQNQDVTLEGQDEKLVGETQAETSIHPDARNAISYATAVAGVAIGELPEEPAFADTGKLHGLLALMARMILGGDPEESDPLEGPSYPKAIATILPRTDFAAMFGTLPEEQKHALKADHEGQPRFVWLISRVCGHGDVGGLDKPVLGWTGWGQLDPGMIVPDLTRRAWAEGIVVGTDRLSQSGYLTWLDQRKVEEPELGKRKKEAEQLDSLGSYHEKMDTGEKGEPLPLVEFRALARGDSLRMTVPQAKEIGLRLAAYVDQLAKRKVKF